MLEGLEICPEWVHLKKYLGPVDDSSRLGEVREPQDSS